MFILKCVLPLSYIVSPALNCVFRLLFRQYFKIFLYFGGQTRYFTRIRENKDFLSLPGSFLSYQQPWETGKPIVSSICSHKFTNDESSTYINYHYNYIM